MPQPSSPRAVAQLSDPVRQHLTMYARAASAAGVGILALVPSAHAKIVYTPANIPIAPNAGLVELDLNNDSVSDFAFSNTYKNLGSEAFSSRMTVGPTRQRNRIWSLRTFNRTQSQWHTCAAALRRGTTIGPDSPFGEKLSVLPMLWMQNGDYGCPWLSVYGEDYLGLKFRIKGNVHFGWARVTNVFHTKDQTRYITGYAYETVANKPIITGHTKGADVVTVQPASLGHLAHGASAIPAWRAQH